MERVILKSVLALCFFASLVLAACSEEPDKLERTQTDDSLEETTVAVEQPGKPPEGVQTYDVGSANVHTEENVDYEQTPSAGGAHNPVWQNCGFYEKPIRDENAVHSLEHGAVWITYLPNLPRTR